MVVDGRKGYEDNKGYGYEDINHHPSHLEAAEELVVKSNQRRLLHKQAKRERVLIFFPFLFSLSYFLWLLYLEGKTVINGWFGINLLCSDFCVAFFLPPK